MHSLSPRMPYEELGMVSFVQVRSSRLYQSDSNVVGAGWWGFQVVPSAPSQGFPVTLYMALTDAKLSGTFVYSVNPPDLSTPEKTTDFIAAIDAILANIIGTRALIFLPDGPIRPETARTVVLTQSGSKVNTGINVPLENTGVLIAQLAAGSLISTTQNDNALLFEGAGLPSMSLGGLLSTDTYQPDNFSVLQFAGPIQGTFTFGVYIRRLALLSRLNWGFQALIPNSGSDTILYLTAWLPFAYGDQPSSTDMLGFTAQINMVNPNNLLPASLTKLFFTGLNSNGGDLKTRMVSCYITNAGKPITLYPIPGSGNGLQPAALVITCGYKKTPLQNGFNLAPDGDFALATADGKVNQPAYLMCGMSGTETVAFLPFVEGQYLGYRVRFCSNMPAYAYSFPLQASSPVGPPIDPAALLLKNQFVTAWGNVIAPPNDSGAPLYAAAPKGADLFGLAPGTSNLAGGNFLIPLGPGVALPPTVTFPLIPYGRFTAGGGQQDLTSEQMEQLERQVLSPTRRNIITGGTPKLSAHALMCLAVSAPVQVSCPFYTTTPTGFISHVRCNGTWDQLLLAQVCKPGSSQVSLQMGFTLLNSALQAAFQTNNLFLVVANATLLGTPREGTFMPPAQVTVDNQNLFFNTVTIGDWKFQANVGTENQYSDYRNVMIVKGVKGKLTDLVLNPEKWTMKDSFGAPSIRRNGAVTDPDVSQLIPLSNWMNDYFDTALEHADNPFFANFCRLIQDENWTGVLFLRVDIAQVPADLAGILAGVNDPSAFYAHHLGIEIGQIDNLKVQQKDASSLFGLVYYLDPNYDDTGTAHPIPPSDLNTPYDFTLLTLKAIFQNSGLQKFESLAQVMLNRVFGSTVKKMGEGGNIYNVILLQGAFQKNGDAPVYSLASTGTSTYELDNNILTLAEIDSAVMSTRDDGTVSGQVVSWISMSGFMNFAVIHDNSESTPKLPDFDIFSFGSTGSSQQLRQGLNFNNLGLRISFEKTPSGQGITSNAAENDLADQSRLIEMIEGEISFNIAASTPRELSLYRNFQLELLSLQSGDDTTTPQSTGYITVGTQYGLQGVSSGAWHGLRCKLNLGTPGALASKVNLNSTLLLAWSDESGSGSASGYQALVGIELPGTGSGGDLFSLQSVIKLSIGVVQLYYNDSAKSFLLLLNEIALKFLGLLRVPPNGATAFFLFGNSNVQDSTGLAWYAIYNQEQPKPPQLEGVAAKVLPRT